MNYNKLLLPLMMLMRKAKPTDQPVSNGLIKTRVWYICDISILRHDIRNVLAALTTTGPKSIWPRDDGTMNITAYEKHGFDSCDLYVYKRIPLILSRKSSKDFGTCAELMTFNTPHCRAMLHEFLEKCMKAIPKYYNNSLIDQIDIVGCGGCNGQYVSCSPKTFDDVFLPKEQESAIVNGINNFINNIPWMEHNHIPSHYGILLYGTPGCGRTSIIKAIINKWNLIPHYIHSLEDLPGLVTSKLPTRQTTTKELHMVICEDVDCTLFNRQKDFKESEDVDRKEELDEYVSRYKPKKVSLSQVLNSIDGLVAPHNCIFIFTTNHIEELDPALIRPGRMDLHLEIKPICEETLNKFTLKFFGRSIPKDFKCKEGILFSQLQTMIIGGSTFDDILNFMKKEEEVYNEKQ